MDKYYDMDILARTLYGECEPNNEQEARAIACVVLNRSNNPQWKMRGVAEVCLQPLQFSCWNSNDPNRARIMKAKSGPWFKICQKVAEDAVELKIKDETHGATHYYLDAIKTPKWAKNKKPCYKVAHKNGTSHLFFNDIDTKPPKSAKDKLDQERPLTSTRTMQAGTISVAATAASIATDLNDVKTQIEPLADYSDTIRMVLIFVVLAGIAVMMWSRYDDRKKGHR